MRLETLPAKAGSGRLRFVGVRGALGELVLARTLGATLASSVVFILGPGLPVASADSCPNAAFRTGASANLPDCRAYEMVSPAVKSGQIQFTEPLVLDGSHIFVSSLGAFGNPGDNAGAGGSSYLGTRNEAKGWEAAPLNPPASQFPYLGEWISPQPLQDVSQDFRRTLFYGAPSTSKAIDERFYRRESDGSLLEVGPTVPPAGVASWTGNKTIELDQPVATYRGASRDFSHVLFSSQPREASLIWPGSNALAEEGGSKALGALYEYVGAHNTAPRLVGVDNEGHLISQCGTFLGSHGAEDTFNAISRDGATVFFTAGKGECAGINEQGALVTGAGPTVTELYARVDGSKTVHISEPSAEDCSACKTTPAQEGIFQGASEDGSKVFFLSKQELLPGATGNNLYEYDFGAPEHEKVTLVAPKVLGVARVSAEGTRVYYVTEGNGLAVYDTTRGSKTFIAMLSSADKEDWSTLDARPVEATPDGRFVLFASTNDLTPDAAGPSVQLYRYDAHTQGLVRVSIGQNGFNNNGNNAESAGFVPPSYSQEEGAGMRGVSISDDGSYVFFESSAGLTPQAIDDATEFVKNVYEYHSGQVYLISDGQDRHEAYPHKSAVSLLGASSSGSDVFFKTADQLLPQDTDTQQDIYDARILGGFPAQPASPPCTGEGCRGAPGSPPAFAAPVSSTFSGAGNLVTPPSTAGGAGSSARGLARAQKLAHALKACRKKPRKSRAVCERQARRKYATKSNARHINRRGR